MKGARLSMALRHGAVGGHGGAGQHVFPRVRLFVVPVLRDRWVLSLPEHAAGPAEESTTATSPTSTSETEGKGGWLWRREELQRRGLELMQKAREAYDNMPREGMRGHLRNAVDALHRRLDPTESVLKALPSARAKVHGAMSARDPAHHVPDQHGAHHGHEHGHGHGHKGHVQLEVTYPTGLDEALVRATLPALVSGRTKRHQNLIYGSTAMLPVSLAMGLLPGPNVFLAWNVYRLYSHTQALRGGQLFLELLHNDHVHYISSPELEEIIRTEERTHTPLDKTQIEELSAKYALKGLAEDVERLLRKHKAHTSVQ